MQTISFIGFGEAGQAFAADWPPMLANARAYDVKTDSPPTRAAKFADYSACAVEGCETRADALAGADAVFSLVTADSALAAAEAGAPHLTRGALWLDMNSVAPETKRAAAAGVERAGGRYVDVAVMAPVHPARRNVPLLVSGPHAEAGAGLLRTVGFGKVRIVDGPVGAASAIKMIRSVMVKGMEALSAECILAAEAAGVLDEVVASLEATPPESFAQQVDYNLERMMLHGLRRAAEMEEVVKTLDGLGTGSAMSRGTVEGQRDIGSRTLPPIAGLRAKLAALLGEEAERAA
ncbi:DUF1932 domain-containing protein [Qipengyuania sp. MTN3-11]|uniref:NAD(P)-dependent oxidoreductase n=1 Tax=Qipengyuania sp. MTN3-11 TaxID=3056557 RepID=UPI0036F41953